HSACARSRWKACRTWATRRGTRARCRCACCRWLDPGTVRDHRRWAWAICRTCVPGGWQWLGKSIWGTHARPCWKGCGAWLAVPSWPVQQTRHPQSKPALLPVMARSMGGGSKKQGKDTYKSPRASRLTVTVLIVPSISRDLANLYVVAAIRKRLPPSSFQLSCFSVNDLALAILRNVGGPTFRVVLPALRSFRC